MERDDVLNVRIPGDIKEALRVAAAADGRSISSKTERILREWLTENGFLKPERNPVARKTRTR